MSALSNLRTSMRWLGVSIVVATATTVGAQVATAQTAPGTPVHMWLFDEFDVGSGYALEDYGSSITPLALYPTPHAYTTASGYTHGVLVGNGDSLGTLQPSSAAWVAPNASVILGAGATPFAYAGNKSAALDWKAGNNTYPTRTYAGGLSADVAATTDLVSPSGSISLWFNPVRHAGTGEQYLFTFRNSSTGQRMYFRGPESQSTGNERLVFRDGASDQILTLPSLNMPLGAGEAEPSSDWYHYAFIWDAGGFDAYENGALIASNSLTMLDWQPNIFQIGSYSNYTAGAPGLYDEFAIWDTALTADNVNWLYQNSLTDLNSTAAVPEPTSAALFVAVGTVAFIGFAWHRRPKVPDYRT